MRCTIETRDFGTMVFTLYPEYAPLTVANFVKTARSGFYDGLCWCRIVKDYVIQGGSPDNDIMTDSDWHIKGEFTENGVNNPLKHIRGALSMARDDDFDTAGTQFFVVHKDAAKLDGRYAAFGEMESGFDVLDAIANQPTYGPETWNKPKQMPVITKITIEDQHSWHQAFGKNRSINYTGYGAVRGNNDFSVGRIQSAAKVLPNLNGR